MNITDLFKFETDELILVPNQEGDVKSVDLLTFVDRLTIKESLNQMFIQGSLDLTVPKGYFSSLGVYLGPSDLLKLSLRTFKTLTDNEYKENNVYFSNYFIINRINRVNVTSDIYDKYSISFITPEAVKDKGVKIQKSFSNVKRSDAIKQIYNNNLKVDAELISEVESDNSDFCCVIPNWAPSKTIHWFLTGCSQNETKNFYFFQRTNKEGKIETVFDHFKNFSKQKVSVGKEKEYGSGYVCSIDSLNTADELPDPSNYGQKMKYVISEPIIFDKDTLEKSMSGVWSSRTYFYDPTTKKYTVKDFNYKNDGPNPLLNEGDRKFVGETNIIQLDETLNSPSSTVFLLPKARYRFKNDEPDIGVDRKEQWFQEHISQKEICLFNSVMIETPGDSQRRAGETVIFSNLLRQEYNGDNTNNGFEQDSEGREMGAKYLIFEIERIFEFPQGNKNPRSVNKMILVRDGITE